MKSPRRGARRHLPPRRGARRHLLHQMIDEAAMRRPEAPAIRCDGETLSYEQLARRSNRLARVLLDTGLERQDRVAVLLTKGFRVPAAFYGVLE